MEDKKELFDEQLDAVTGGVPPHIQGGGKQNSQFAKGQFAQFAKTKGVNMQFGRSNFANQNMNSVRSNFANQNMNSVRSNFENTNTQFSNTNINFNNTNNSNEN